MNRQIYFTSQASRGDKFNDSSQQSTLNVTLKDLNIEVRKILRKALLQENGKTTRNERDAYLSGPCFPCQDYKLKKRLRKNSMASLTKNSTNGRISKTEKCPDIMVKENKPNQIEYIEVEPVEMKVLEAYEGVGKTKIPILFVSDLTEEQQVSKLPEPEEKQCVPSTTKQCLQQETKNEFENTKLLEENRNQVLRSSDSRRHSSLLEPKLSKGEQYGNKTKEDCSHQGTRNDDFENTKLLEGKIDQLPSSPNSRRPSRQLEPSPRSSRGTTPIFEGRRESRLSSASNENRTSPKKLKSNHISNSTDEFALDHISNPLLRESLKKILNPQSYVGDFNATANITREKTTPLVARQRQSVTLFEDQILFPSIKERFKHSSLDTGEQSKRSSCTNDSFNKYKKRSAKVVRFAGNKLSLELSSTKCTGIKVTPCHPVRMLSPGSEYAVKGLIGQWLKRRSRNTVQTGKEKQSVEKQEAYREVQLLKVGLSMRMLAGIV